MHFKEPLSNLLADLQYILEELTDQQYVQPIKILSQATIGQHNRHILEFFVELNKGYDAGIVNYDKRSRNHTIETDRAFAIQTIRVITENIDKPDRDLLLNVEYGNHPVFTNYFRELVYNLEHTVHHMALIRIGLNTISDLAIPEHFGVAASTIKYRKACAQ
jgi:hypothetical protein